MRHDEAARCGSLSVAKLNLNRDSIAWDIGAGTGSVTIEMALAAADGEVYAIEKKSAAAASSRRTRRSLAPPMWRCMWERPRRP